MTHQTDYEEGIIDISLEILKEKHSKYEPEIFAHYVVKGEYQEECEGEEYCEKCIDKAVREYRDLHNRKRAQELLKLKDLERNGYFFRWVYNEEYECRSLAIYFAVPADKKRIKEKRKSIEIEYPKGLVFSYRYFQMDSRCSFENCENCGIIISSCVTPDDQEIKHWESMDDSRYIITEMDDYTAYQLYEWIQFINQADEDVYKIGIQIIERFLKINNVATKC